MSVEIHSYLDEFNPTSEVQNIENGVFQNAPFANGRFPNCGYGCLWAEIHGIAAEIHLYDIHFL